MPDVTEQPRPDLAAPVSRGHFLRNAARGGIMLATAGGVLASAEGVALAAGPTSSDVSTLQAAYVAESLAVYVYSAILTDFRKFNHPRLSNRDYFVAALRDEREHKALLGRALGARRPSDPKFTIPAAAVSSGEALLRTGVALETAFVEAYLGAVQTFSSTELKVIAAKIAANEASHFSFLDAAAGGHGVLPALPRTATIPATLRKLKPFLA